MRARVVAAGPLELARPFPLVVGIALVAIMLSILLPSSAGAATGGVGVPTGSASPDRPSGDRGSAGSGRSGSGAVRSGPTGGVRVPPPGARRTDDSGGDRGRKDDKKADDKKADDKKGRDTGDRKDDDRKPERDPKPPSTDDDDRPGPGPGAADIPSHYLALYRAAATAADVSWRLVAAVGKNESDHGRSKLPGVRSGVNGAGCCSGPMQICTVRSCGNTWDAYRRDGNGDGVASVYEAADSIHAAAALLGELQRTFGKHPAYILAGYNAGPGTVQRHRGVPPYRETQAYVKRGLDYMRTLR